jgi:hypothetical protein
VVPNLKFGGSAKERDRWREQHQQAALQERDRRIATKSRRRANGSQCFCDECEGLMAEGLV